MSEPLGLSIGVANLVAVRAGGTPVTRSSVLTLFDDRPTEVGLPEENPNLTKPGLVMRGFVERVGDRNPLVAADGTKYLGDALMVEALEALARTVGYGSPITIAVPAYWSEAQAAAVRSEFFAQPGLAAEGVTPVLISDAAAGLAALRTKPGFPRDGVVALCDFGAGGTSVTLINASSNFQQIGQSVRYGDFSGEAIDQLVATYVRSGGQDAATSTNVAAATRPASPTLLGECRRAKEQLSSGTTATIATGQGADFRLSRTELEQLISAPLDQFLASLAEVLQRNGIPHASLAAVAALGGGAGVPLITARLAERLRVPVLTTPEPMFAAAIGAAALGAQHLSGGAATAAGAAVELPTELVGTPETEALRNQEADTDKPTYALAWSQDSATGGEPIPYTGPEHSGGYGVEGVEPAAQATAPEDRHTAGPGPLPWYKRTALVVTVAAALAAVLLAVVLALTMGHGKTNPVRPKEPTPSQTPQTVTITGPNNSPTTTVIQPPPATSQPPATTTTQPPVTTTTAPTTTTQPPTTTTTQRTTSSQATTTSSQAPSTSTQRTTTAAPTPPTRRPFGPAG
ncbi:molecular chaperone [Mycobacterium sp. 852002-51163_SCH5372311]|uniref:Hsp70 family protein n=1 Tax=Mycobacterium sp. 852002-51163_SCH5372311 TaxID=1834097 RepID=UPI0007FC1CE0|nr:Hsp70 family protein [Mycobacterium sp. 852002-51163_SCH5372311]OBF92829.1 molecular chaperone [Mycobacterium sp. 852002-51163_SCH5372311]